MPGADTSLSETIITNIERSGFWLLVEDGEYFVSFDAYPEFQNATVQQIHTFTCSRGQIYWPDLDIDIELEALQHPERFPLKFRRH